MKIAWNHLGFVLICALFSCTTTVCGKPDKTHIKREDVKIVDGTPDCITNCSRVSSRNNVFMQCSVEECKPLQEDVNTSQESEIDKKDVVFEKYYDEGQEKLALRIAWSPVDNVSLEKTKGYLINISDGVSSYSTCYYVKDMTFNSNSHDIYFNDCFGKAPGTSVVPGSVITANITTLPLWKFDHYDGTATRKIEVPNCSSRQLSSLAACDRPGGQPTTQLCVSDSCNATSNVGTKSHPVKCTISHSSLLKFEGPEKCDKVNKNVTGTPSAAVHLKSDQDWYKYWDEDEVKVALNFSWTPARDSSITSLHHYYMEILPLSVSSAAPYAACYAIHTQLSEDKHKNVSFYYDCYGRSDHSKVRQVEPGHSYQVHIESRPATLTGQNSIQIRIEVPTCQDERMSDVTKCIEENKNREIIGRVDQIYCSNHSIKYTYSIPEKLGNGVKIHVCETGRGLEYCSQPITTQTSQRRSGTIYSIGVPSNTKPSQNISIYVHPIGESHTRTIAFFDFSECAKPPELQTFWMLILIVIFGILCVIAILFLVCYFYRGDCRWKNWIPRPFKPQDQRPGGNRLDIIPPRSPDPNLNKDPEPATIQDGTRVYVVFMDDNIRHKEVVHWFCCYLKQDLGLDVKLNIWENEVVATNPTMYMKNNIELAQKVIIICSHGTEKCMNKKYDGDMFTPVVRDVCNQTFLGKDPGKFLVGYFPYSHANHVPEMLRDQCLMYFSLFQLMKQFEQFYFRIVGVEQFQEGGIQRIEKIAFDRYYDPELTTCGRQLKLCIDAMVEFNRNNPTWFQDQFGCDLPMADIPPSPVPNHTGQHRSGSILDQTTIGYASINHLDARPPPLLNGQISSNKPQNVGPDVNYGPPGHHQHGGYQQLKQTPSTSTDGSSYVCQDTDIEQLSSVPPPTPDSPEDHKKNYFSTTRNTSVDHQHVNQLPIVPESFNDDDFRRFDRDESVSSELLPSNMTEVTVLGLTKSQEQLKSEQLNLLNENLILVDVEDVDPDDVENVFRTINS